MHSSMCSCMFVFKICVHCMKIGSVVFVDHSRCFTWQVVIGADDNHVTELLMGASVLSSVSATNGIKPLDCQIKRPYWISWDNSVISVGTGNRVGEGKLLSHELSSGFATNAITVNSIRNKGVWLFDTSKLYVVVFV